MKNTQFKIIRNDRKGLDYEDVNLKCDRCSALTTRYISIKGIKLCRNCLSDLNNLCALDLLKVVTDENYIKI